MNVGIITQTNVKGQIVIPKKFREKLGIDEKVALNISLRGRGVYITPVEEIFSTDDNRKIFLEILKKTAGTWAGDSWPETAKRRRKIELEASRKRKNIW